MVFFSGETSADGSLWSDVFPPEADKSSSGGQVSKLESQSSKYLRVFLWLRFRALLDLGPHLTVGRGLIKEVFGKKSTLVDRHECGQAPVCKAAGKNGPARLYGAGISRQTEPLTLD